MMNRKKKTLDQVTITRKEFDLMLKGLSSFTVEFCSVDNRPYDMTLSDFGDLIWETLTKKQRFNWFDTYLTKVNRDQMLTDFFEIYGTPENASRANIEPEAAFESFLTEGQQAIVDSCDFFPVAQENYYNQRRCGHDYNFGDSCTPHETGNSGAIYILRSHHGCKIGMSIDPISRTKNVAGSLPFPTHLIHVAYYHEYDRIEKELHEIFAIKRLHGEWFTLTEDDIEFIKNYKPEEKVEEDVVE